MPPGRLFLVATPIGNLGDLTFRAVETLKEVAFIACEDTRHSKILFDRYGVSKPTVSLPAFDEKARAQALAARIAGGEDCALVTDAGSPAISDPGEALVAAALAAGVTVVPLPGPSALIAALGASGLPTSRFHFLGFLPRTGKDRRAMLEEVAGTPATLALYEAGNRVRETLKDLAEALGAERRACVARELTKVHEEFVRGTLGELAGREEWLGEVVILVEGRTGSLRWSEEEVRRAVSEGLASGGKLKALSTEIAQRSGWPAKEIYRLGLTLR